MATPGSLFERRYDILELLARGGMGAVYRARRVVLGDDVAIKVLTSPGDEAMRERFLRESRAAAQLRHPHIVSILDYDVDVQGHPYLVMEYLNGPSLLQRLAVDRRIAVDEVRRLVPLLCGAFQVAHAAGVVHRDIKPANIVGHQYGSGEFVYKVVDFGLAHMRETPGDLRLTMAREFVGTVLYASPEQLRGEPTDARSDIYSLGATVYELLTGRPPFVHDEPFAIVSSHLTRQPRPLRELVPDIPADVDAAVMRTLEKDPDARFASMEAFATALTSGGAHGVPAVHDETVLPEIRGYEVESRIASGRLGSRIYRARHATMQTPAAIRVLRRSDVPDWEAARDRFLREARAMQVTHPGLLQVRDIGESPDLLYVVTDLLEGDSVSERVDAAGPMAWPDLQRLAGQLVDAVAALHRRGAFICGVSPFTTRLLRDADGDRLVVSSGGISRVQDLLGTLSEAALRGDEIRRSELPYVAPEVLMGEAPSVAADLFAVGALIHFMAAGAPPFCEGSLPELLGAMLRKPPALLETERPDVPAPFSAAIRRCLSPLPGERPPDARALAMAL